MVQSIIDESKHDYEYHIGRLEQFIGEYISIFKRVEDRLRYLNVKQPIKATHISLVGSPNDITRLNELVVELDRFLLDKNFALLIIEKGIKAAQELKQKANGIKCSQGDDRMYFRINDMIGYGPYTKELGILRKLIDEFERKISEIDRMKVLVRQLGGLEGFLKSILEIRISTQIFKEHLDPSFSRFIENLPYTGVRLIDFRSEVNSLKEISQYVIYKLKNARNLVKYLRILGPKMKSLSDYQTCCRSDNIEHIISKLIQFNQNVRNKVSYVNRDLNRFKIQNFVIKGQKYPDSFIETIKEIHGKTFNNVEFHINQLKAIKKIQGHLEKIKEKREQLSTAKSKIGGIISVESGIIQLEQIRGAIESFSSIAEDIRKLESTYNFELRTSLDIGGEVKGLMSVISDIVKMRSEIESYIKFLEEIKTSSKVLGSKESEVAGLPSVNTTGGKLIVCLSSLKDKLSSIETAIGTIKKISCRMCNVENMKSNIKKIRQLVFNIQVWLASVQDITNRIHAENAKISYQLKIISTLIHISSNIESSSSSLSNTGISYTKPESDRQKILIECLFRAGQASEFIGSYTVKTVYGNIKSIAREIESLEESIDSLMKCFLKCSNKFITKNTIESTKTLLIGEGQLYNNELAKPLIRCLENIGCQ